MKFRKPQWSGATAGRVYFDACMKLISDLPDEFEIVPEGHVCVKWPEELTRERLAFLADKIKAESVNAWESWPAQESALRSFAAIAPEKTKQMRRRVSVLQFQGHGENFGKLELSFNMDPQFPWVKVGECEIEN